MNIYFGIALLAFLLFLGPLAYEMKMARVRGVRRLPLWRVLLNWGLLMLSVGGVMVGVRTPKAIPHSKTLPEKKVTSKPKSSTPSHPSSTKANESTTEPSKEETQPTLGSADTSDTTVEDSGQVQPSNDYISPQTSYPQYQSQDSLSNNVEVPAGTIVEPNVEVPAESTVAPSSDTEVSGSAPVETTLPTDGQ